MLRWTIVMVYVTIICGCIPDKISESDILGNYHIHYPHGDEWLMLSSDNVYTQVYSGSRASRDITNGGHWKFNPDKTSVVLKDALFFTELDGSVRNPPDRGVWGLKIFKTRDSFKLLICEDLQFFFKPVGSKNSSVSEKSE